MGSSPNWSYLYVPTAAQWNAAFAAKQDDLGYNPVNRAGDSMVGRLVTFGSNTTEAGFNLTPGLAPNVPVNGDVWVTAIGIYAHVAGVTVGPISTGTVTSVGLAAPAQFTVTNSPVTGTGDLTLAWATQAANIVFAGPTTGSAAVPAFRALVGADLPDPGASSKGGVKSKTAETNKFLTGIGTDGGPTNAQPAFSDLSGAATSGQIAAGVAVANLGYTPLNPANNLSDVANPVTAITNIGGVGLASVNTFTAAQQWSEGAAIASASTLTLGADGNFFHVTGTTTITAISGTATPVFLVFDGALQLTYNASTFILPGAANIAVAAGDMAIFVFEGGSSWRCICFTRAASLPYDKNNIVGTVSQSGGIPTGAVMEIGSNANGYYAKHASGFMICWNEALAGSGNTSTAVGNIFKSADFTWTFPAAFVSANPAVVAGLRGTTRWASTGASGLTTCDWSAYSYASVSVPAAMIYAVGKWF